MGPHPKITDMDKRTVERNLHVKTVFCGVRSIRALCGVLQIDQRRLLLLAKQPPYRSFTIPKKDGGERQSRAPGRTQGCWASSTATSKAPISPRQSSAAYGFIAGVKNDDDRRNVVTNARKHLRQKIPAQYRPDRHFFHAVTKRKGVPHILPPTHSTSNAKCPNS